MSLTGNFSDLVKSVQQATVPKWLHEYVGEHRNEMIFDLRLTGKHIIQGPDCTITLSVQPPKGGSR